MCVALRTSVARWSYLMFRTTPLEVTEISTVEYLAFKERLVNGRPQDDEWALEVDLAPFSREFTKMKEARSIGRGVEFMNRSLSSTLFERRGRNVDRLLEFLHGPPVRRTAAHAQSGHRRRGDLAVVPAQRG